MFWNVDFDEICDVRWCHTMERLVGKERFKDNAIFDWKPVKLDSDFTCARCRLFIYLIFDWFCALIVCRLLTSFMNKIVIF